MNAKRLFLTHDTTDMGKKTNYLPMTGGTCTRKPDFRHTFGYPDTRNGGFPPAFPNKLEGFSPFDLAALNFKSGEFETFEKQAGLNPSAGWISAAHPPEPQTVQDGIKVLDGASDDENE